MSNHFSEFRRSFSRLENPKLFHHDILDFPELNKIEEDGKRFYVTPAGNFQSVTTVLGSLDEGWLEQWQNNIGKEKADRISDLAASRGDAIHDMCEKYVRNDHHCIIGHIPTHVKMFKDIKPFLDNNLSIVHGIEYCLWSEKLKTAGRSDLFGIYKNKKSVVDYKGSTKPKKIEWIEGYFLQLTTYAMMIEERLNMSVDQIVVLMANENANPQEFIMDAGALREKVNQIFIKDRKC